MHKNQDRATKYSLYAAIAVLAIAPLVGVMSNGLGILSESAFWFGLYGWLAAAIVVGYLVYLGLNVLGGRTAEETEVRASAPPALTLGARVSAGTPARVIAANAVPEIIKQLSAG